MAVKSTTRIPMESLEPGFASTSHVPDWQSVTAFWVRFRTDILRLALTSVYLLWAKHPACSCLLSFLCAIVECYL